MGDTPLPWERQPYDTPTTWAVMIAYLEQDPPRELIAAYRKVRGAKEGIKRVPSVLHSRLLGRNRDGSPIPGALSYLERADAWEDYLAALERKKWVDRRLKIREAEWETGDALLQRGREMLMFPVFEQVSEKDGKTTLIAPAGWRLKDIPVVLAQASKLMRLSAGMSTDNLSINWREEAEKEGLNPDELYSKAVAEIRALIESQAVDGANATGGLGGGAAASGGDDESDV